MDTGKIMQVPLPGYSTGAVRRGRSERAVRSWPLTVLYAVGRDRIFALPPHPCTHGTHIPRGYTPYQQIKMDTQVQQSSIYLGGTKIVIWVN